jgi:hypothetical protein
VKPSGTSEEEPKSRKELGKQKKIHNACIFYFFVSGLDDNDISFREKDFKSLLTTI